MFELSNKVIVISGASSGIGRACAIQCSIQGAKIALLGRNISLLKETRDSLSGDGHQIYLVDFSSNLEIAKLIDQIVLEMGVISGLIHSAGMELVLPIRVTEPKHYEQVFRVNVFAAFELARHITKKRNVDSRGCSIVFIASVMSKVGQPTKTIYCSSKGALVAGSKAMALELARAAIRVNCVSPGVVKTNMADNMMAKTTADAVDAIYKAHPLGLGMPNDIAHVCVFLLSDEARWITGTNLVVDGGYLAQ